MQPEKGKELKEEGAELKELKEEMETLKETVVMLKEVVVMQKEEIKNIKESLNRVEEELKMKNALIDCLAANSISVYDYQQLIVLVKIKESQVQSYRHDTPQVFIIICCVYI